MQYFKTLFSSSPYMPHGYCFLWNPGLIGLHVISDLLIALSYLSIPFTLGYFVRKRRDLPFHWMFICFGVFILACGATHAGYCLGARSLVTRRHKKDRNPEHSGR